ncbi:MAG: hypothetical protein K6T54_07040 [Ignavibacterium sp.]|nr:hypothetical protein [Ignavibacterium sp.]
MDKEPEPIIEEWQPDILPEGLTEEETIENFKNLIRFMKEIEKIPEAKKLMEKYRIALVKPPRTQEEIEELNKKYCFYVSEIYNVENGN